jgi:hypothetical protein
MKNKIKIPLLKLGVNLFRKKFVFAGVPVIIQKKKFY